MNPSPASPVSVRPLFWTLASALLLRVAYFRLQIDGPYYGAPFLDELYSDQWAREIASGRLVGERAFFRAPLHAYLLGAFYFVFGPDPAVPLLLQHLLGVAGVGLTWGVARRAFPDRPDAALAAAGVAAFYAPSLFFEGQLLDISLQAVLVPLTLLAAFRAFATFSARDAAAFGLVGGIGAIARPALAPFYAAAFLGARFLAPRASPPPRRVVARAAAVALVAFLVPVAPVALHNWLAERVVVPIATYAGVNLWIGNNAAADGFTSKTPERFMFFGRYEDSVELFAREVAERESGRELDSAEVQSYWSGRALAEIAANPARTAKLFVKKFVLFWTAYEIKNNKNVYFHASFNPIQNALLKVANYGLVAALAVVGFGLSGGLGARRSGLRPDAVSESPPPNGNPVADGSPEGDPRTNVRLALLLSATLMFGVLPFFVNARYRYPFAVSLFPFAGLAAAELVARGRLALAALRAGGSAGDGAASLRWFALVAAPFALALGLANLDPYGVRASEDLSRDEWSVANCFRDKGRLDEAARHYERALAIDPEYADAWNNLGETLWRAGDAAAALDKFRRAAEFSANDPWAKVRALNNAGVALETLGDPAGAVVEYRRALALAPTHALAWQNLGEALLATADAVGARSAYERALELSPDLPLAALGLARAALARGDETTARGALARFLELGGERAAETVAADSRLSELLAARP